MRSMFLPLIFLTILAATVDASEAPGYRVAGIVRQGESWHLAIVEAPDGSSRVLHPGDSIPGEGTIVALNGQGIVLQKDGVTRTLSLQGGRYVSSGGAGEMTGEGVQLSREMLRSELRERLEGQVTRPRRPSNGQPAAASANELLGIPSGARITSINGSTVQNSDDALALVRAGLDQGGLLRVFVDGIEGVSHLYVVLQDEQTPQQ